ncbi:MAG: cation transporter [Gammaproteobacteria bacterium]|nr:MAG: cation transporter [Gammaproteobacteria bacterium]
MSRDNTIDEEAVVQRTFRIEPLSKAALDAACERLRALSGVYAVKVLQVGTNGIQVTYDARQLNAGQILEQLAASGVRPADSLWQRVRMALLRLQDDNIRSNLAHKPSCCSRPPPGAGKGLGGPRH